MMTTEKLNPREVSRKLRPFVDTLLLATAYAQLERERVDAIQRKVLEEQNYYGRVDGRQARIREPKQSWLMDDDSSERYFAKLNAIHLANGFARAADGYCPALCAESLQTEAEWALILAAEEFFPDCTNDRLLCGTKEQGGLETRQKYLDLMIGLVVNSPGYTSPLKTKRIHR